MDPPIKHQKNIPANQVFHIYRKQHSHLITAMGKIIVGFSFFGMRSCEYSPTPNGKNKITLILNKVDIRLYRERCEIWYISSCIHLADKVSTTFRT